jgi:6-phosphogluconolactonase
VTIRILPSAQALADFAADEIAGWISVSRGVSTIGLAGGSTPQATYEELRSRSGIQWEEVHAWMTDERHVPPDDPQSNSGMVRAALFDHVPATFHPVPFLPSARESAEAYEDQLASVLPGGRSALRPGLVLLGVGADGHTASLFPGTTAVRETQRDYVATEVPDRGWRLTSTFHLLARARRTIFLASGRDKAEVVADILAGDSGLPAAVVNRSARDVTWLLDSDAAWWLEH